MDRSSRHPTSSETRLLATPSWDRGRIEETLAHAESHVARMQPSPATQDLKRVLEACRRTIQAWSDSPPSDDELRSLRESLDRTLQLAKTTSPTVRIRRSA